MKTIPCSSAERARAVILSYRRRLAAILALAVLLAGCGASKTTYHKPNADQSAFERDSAECMEFAKKAALDLQISRDRGPDPQAVEKLYSECIMAAGWGRIPPDKRDRSLWKTSGSQLSFGKLTLTLPRGFALREHTRYTMGPTWCEQYQGHDETESVFITLVAQESIAEPFEVMDYPVPAGFVLYTTGHLNKYDGRWSVFFGHSVQKPVAVLAAYIHLNKRQRITVVFNRFMHALGTPEAGYPMSLEQKTEIEALYPAWLEWVKTQTGAHEGDKFSARRYFKLYPLTR